MFCEGGHFVLCPNILRQIYGSKATQMYGIFFSFGGLTSVILLFLQDAFLADNFKAYNLFFIMNGCFSTISLLMLLFLFSQDKYVPKVDRVKFTVPDDDTDE